MRARTYREEGRSIWGAGFYTLVAVVKLVVALIMLSPSLAQAFNEGWEGATIGTYSPDDFILPADEGTWLVGDTVSEFPECGPTPQKAEIIASGGGKALRLTSVDTKSGCADNVWLALFDASKVGPLTINKGFTIPLNGATRISFKQSGVLTNAELQGGWGSHCIAPPCFKNISLQLGDNRGNILAYVLQRPADVEANQPNVHFEDRYREIFLDTDAVSHNRNLFDDFSTVPNFVSSNAQILSINLIVDEHGSAIFDDIAIGADIIIPSPVPEPTPNRPAEPIIMANGLFNSVDISTRDSVSVSISLAAKDYVNQDADFWVAANTPFGWYYYHYQSAVWINVGSSINDIPPTHQGGIVDLPLLEVLNMAALPVGAYTFYFGIDMNTDGQLDIDSLLIDEIVVNVLE